jgi:hypothetical protein
METQETRAQQQEQLPVTVVVSELCLLFIVDCAAGLNMCGTCRQLQFAVGLQITSLEMQSYVYRGNVAS